MYEWCGGRLAWTWRPTYMYESNNARQAMLIWYLAYAMYMANMYKVALGKISVAVTILSQRE